VTRLLRLSAFAVVASLLATPVGSAQQAGAPAGAQGVFKDSIDLIQVSVVVSGPDGQPVHGLTGRDFTIVANGAPRAVDAFAEISTARAPASPFPATLVSDVSDNADAKADRLVIIVLDDLHLKGQTDEVKALARRVVNGLGSGTSLGLITTSGDFGLEPTSDRARVLEVIERFIDRYGSAAAPFKSIGRGPGDLSTFFGDMTMFKASQDVAKMLAGNDSRRKAFVWLSRGIPKTCPQPPEKRPYIGSNMYDHACDSMLYQMQRSDVSTYAVNPGGGSDHFLSGVATATGGIEIRADDLDAGIDRIVDDLNNYYLLGFTPADPNDTKYRDLEVQVNRPGAKLRYRHGYQAAPPPHPMTAAKEAAALVSGVMPKTELHMRASAAPLAARANGDSPVVVSIEVHGDAARFAGPYGWMRDTLKLEVVAVDLDKKRPVLTRTEERSIGWHQTTDMPGETTYLVETVVDLPPGTYQVRTSGTSAALGTSGSVYLIVDVPDRRKATLALGGLLLGYATGPRTPTASEPSSDAGLSFAPTIDREFDTTDRLRLLCEVTRSQPVQDVNVLIELVDSSDRIQRSSAISLAATASPRIETPVDFVGLEPGAYRLRLTATTGPTRAVRELGLIVH
jgi:VWFA-related protein